jgi:hypothetical protein
MQVREPQVSKGNQATMQSCTQTSYGGIGGKMGRHNGRGDPVDTASTNGSASTRMFLNTELLTIRGLLSLFNNARLLHLVLLCGAIYRIVADPQRKPEAFTQGSSIKWEHAE